MNLAIPLALALLAVAGAQAGRPIPAPALEGNSMSSFFSTLLATAQAAIADMKPLVPVAETLGTVVSAAVPAAAPEIAAAESVAKSIATVAPATGIPMSSR